MKVRYLKCMDFVFDDVEVPDYKDMGALSKAIKDSDLIKVVSEDGDIDYVNADYIMYVGVYEK